MKKYVLELPKDCTCSPDYLEAVAARIRDWIKDPKMIVLVLPPGAVLKEVTSDDECAPMAVVQVGHEG